MPYRKPKTVAAPTMDGVEMASSTQTAWNTMPATTATTASAASPGGLPSTIAVEPFIEAIQKYPVPPEYSQFDALRHVHGSLSQANFLCQKQDVLPFDESYFLYLTAVDPDLNPSMSYLPTRFLLLQIALSACASGGATSDIETAFLGAIRERALSNNLQAHHHQRVFFEMWYSNPDFKVQCLRPSYIKRLAVLHSEVIAHINKNKFRLGKEKMRHLNIVAHLIAPTFFVEKKSHYLSNPAFKLTAGRGRDKRVYIGQEVFDGIAAKLKDMDTVAAIGEMFDKLGVSEVLAGEPL